MSKGKKYDKFVEWLKERYSGAHPGECVRLTDFIEEEIIVQLGLRWDPIWMGEDTE